MNWLILLYFIEVGFYPVFESPDIIPEYYTRNQNVFYTDMEVRAVVKNIFFIGLSTKFYIQPDEYSNNYNLIDNEYGFITGVQFKNVEVGISSNFVNKKILEDSIPNGNIYEDHQKLYIRVSNEF